MTALEVSLCSLSAVALQRRERASEILDRVPLKRPVNRRRRHRHETSQRRSPVLVAAVRCNLINPTIKGRGRHTDVNLLLPVVGGNVVIFVKFCDVSDWTLPCAYIPALEYQ